MLSLLPRSATGQKLTVYTQLLHKPFPDQQRHLILLDNGRTRLRNSPLKEALYCIRCGACLNACPVFRELSGHAYIGSDLSIAPYPGPIGSVISPGLLGKNYVQLAQASSLCGACKEVCPVDIDLPKLLTRVRAGMSRRTMDQWTMGQCWSWTFLLDQTFPENICPRRVSPDAVCPFPEICLAGNFSACAAFALGSSARIDRLGLQQGLSALCREDVSGEVPK